MYEDLENDSIYQDAQETCFTFGSAFLPNIVTRTNGLYFWTASGSEVERDTSDNKVMDWTSGQMSCLLGHGNPEIVKTVQSHAAELDHLYSGMLSPPVVGLAKGLTGVLPNGLEKAMFLSTGGEANEAAIKMAKTYTGKFEIVGLSMSWHGMTSGAIGAQYNAGRKGFGPLMPGMHMLQAPDSYRSIFRHPDGSHDWETEMNYGWQIIDKASCGNLAAVIIEPILSSGGMITLPFGYMKAMKAHCDKRGMLLIVDEAQTAFRCGNLFAIEHESNQGVVPDILTLSKTLGNGIPLSAVVTSNAIANSTREKGFMFYTTHANDPLPCAVGLKVLDIVVRDDRALIRHAQKMGDKLHYGLQALREKNPFIGTIRGRGLMAGIEIVKVSGFGQNSGNDHHRSGREADIVLGKKLCDRMLRLGLSAMISARDVFSGCIRLAPPIVITNEEMEWALEVMDRAFAAVKNEEIHNWSPAMSSENNAGKFHSLKSIPIPM